MNYQKLGIWLATGLSILIMTTNAAVYRCEDGSGGIAFQDTPCESGSDGERYQIDKAPPERDDTTKLDNDRSRKPKKSINSTEKSVNSNDTPSGTAESMLQCGSFEITDWRSYSVDDVATVDAARYGVEGEVLYWPCVATTIKWQGRGMLTSQRNWRRIGNQLQGLLNDGRSTEFIWTSASDPGGRFKRNEIYQARFCFAPPGQNNVEISKLECSNASY